MLAEAVPFRQDEDRFCFNARENGRSQGQMHYGFAICAHSVRCATALLCERREIPLTVGDNQSLAGRQLFLEGFVNRGHVLLGRHIAHPDLLDLFVDHLIRLGREE